MVYPDYIPYSRYCGKHAIANTISHNNPTLSNRGDGENSVGIIEAGQLFLGSSDRCAIALQVVAGFETISTTSTQGKIANNKLQNRGHDI